MAYTSSQSASPHYDLDSNGETDESWQFIDYSSGASGAPSVGFLPSPASGSLNGFAIVGHVSTPSQTSLSPLPAAELDNQVFLPPASSHQRMNSIGSNGLPTTSSSGGMQSDPFLTPQDYLFAQDSILQQTSPQNLPADFAAFDWDQANNTEYLPGMNEFQLDETTILNTDLTFMNEQQINDAANAVPGAITQQPAVLQWQLSQSNLTPEAISPENFISWHSDQSVTGSSPKSPSVKSDASKKSPSLPIRKVKSGKVEKKKTEETGKFLIMTPNSISAQAGRANAFECFEAMRTSQRGRKGPLANATKENALQVRRQGACFCCRSRKVKCDTQRPCQHCKRLMTHVPQVVCWQFQDFLTSLFPDFMRRHLRKEEVAKFLTDNIERFEVDGVKASCRVKLFSGPSFSSTLEIDASFFTAKTCEVLQHWHLRNEQNGVDLQSNGSTPIGIDMPTGKKRDEMRKKVKGYIQNIIAETTYAEQVTDSLRSTQLPVKILRIAQRYANQTDSPLVKKALSIYAMQYVMTRHLCLTTETITSLRSSGLVPQNSQWVTPRVLARQLKSLVDELCMREMQNLFELFTKALKPKYRKEWAPSFAAFLVLCLFMEAVETMTDNFVIAQNNINKRDNAAPQFKRLFALDMCTEIENMPFKQFAYQFHNIYQTHSKDVSTTPFNPLFDRSFQEAGELDGPAIEMVESVRQLFYGEDWQDIQYLVDDDLLLNRDDSPSCLDTAFLYSGRLVAKFLMSFMDENAIFGSKI